MSLRSSLNQLRSLAENIREILPQWRTFVENPRLLGSVLEEANPKIANHFLNIASSLMDPYLAGMGLKVESITEESISVRLPGRWKNRAEGGVVHVGALATLAEFVTRLYWSRHLDLQLAELRVTQMNAQFFKSTNEDVRALMTVSEAERETILFRLRAEEQVKTEMTVDLFDNGEQLVAQVMVEWQFVKVKALGPGSGEGSTHQWKS